MNKRQLVPLKTVLLSIKDEPPRAWLYLPKDRNWSIDSLCAVLESEEVPPELEDDPEAGVPQFAKQNELLQALPVTVVQDVVMNAKAQKPDASPEDFFRAMLFYYRHDAFIKLTG